MNDKLYSRIGEVAALLNVEPHVLRYWQTEFPMLNPKRFANKFKGIGCSDQRFYTPQDIEIARRIKELLYTELYTIAGARRQLEKDKVQTV